MKLGRHHADHLSAHATHFDRSAKDARISSEALLPKGVAQNHEVVLEGNILARIKRSSQLRPRTEDGKQFRGYGSSGQSNGLPKTSQVELATFNICPHIHGAQLLTHGNNRALRIGACHTDEPFGI